MDGGIASLEKHTHETAIEQYQAFCQRMSDVQSSDKSSKTEKQIISECRHFLASCTAGEIRTLARLFHAHCELANDRVIVHIPLYRDEQVIIQVSTVILLIADREHSWQFQTAIHYALFEYNETAYTDLANKAAVFMNLLNLLQQRSTALLVLRGYSPHEGKLRDLRNRLTNVTKTLQSIRSSCTSRIILHDTADTNLEGFKTTIFEHYHATHQELDTIAQDPYLVGYRRSYPHCQNPYR